mgnify:CR=1 FL=1
MFARIFDDCREGRRPRSLLHWNFDAPSACCGVFDYMEKQRYSVKESKLSQNRGIDTKNKLT